MLSAVSSILAKESGLSRWGAIWAIVAGVVAVLLVVWNILRWWWAKKHQPRLVIECGDGPRFNRDLALTLEEVKLHGDPQRLPERAFAKVLTVRETEGFPARNVSVAVLSMDPDPDPQASLPVNLHWQGKAMTDSADIPPGGHKDIVFQTILVYGPPWEFFVVAPFGSVPPVKVTLGIFLDGRKHKTETFSVAGAWGGSHSIVYDHGADLLDRFPYPTLSAQPKRK